MLRNERSKDKHNNNEWRGHDHKINSPTMKRTRNWCKNLTDATSRWIEFQKTSLQAEISDPRRKIIKETNNGTINELLTEAHHWFHSRRQVPKIVSFQRVYDRQGAVISYFSHGGCRDLSFYIFLMHYFSLDLSFSIS